MEGEESYYYSDDKPDSSIFIYAGTPIGIPPELLKENPAHLNKQLAFSNLDEAEAENIKEDIVINYLESISQMKRYELDRRLKKRLRQVMVLANCLLSLGKKGFLLEKATTSVKEFRESREDGRRRLIPLLR